MSSFSRSEQPLPPRRNVSAEAIFREIFLKKFDSKQDKYAHFFEQNNIAKETLLTALEIVLQAEGDTQATIKASWEIARSAAYYANKKKFKDRPSIPKDIEVCAEISAEYFVLMANLLNLEPKQQQDLRIHVLEILLGSSFSAELNYTQVQLYNLFEEREKSAWKEFTAVEEAKQIINPSDALPSPAGARLSSPISERSVVSPSSAALPLSCLTPANARFDYSSDGKSKMIAIGPLRPADLIGGTTQIRFSYASDNKVTKQSVASPQASPGGNQENNFK